LELTGERGVCGRKKVLTAVEDHDINRYSNRLRIDGSIGWFAGMDERKGKFARMAPSIVSVSNSRSIRVPMNRGRIVIVARTLGSRWGGKGSS